MYTYPLRYCKLIEGSLTIDEEEESSGLVRYSPSDEGLPSAWRAVEEYTPGWFYSDGLEQLRMTQRKLHHLQHPGSILRQGKDTKIQHSSFGTHTSECQFMIKPLSGEGEGQNHFQEIVSLVPLPKTPGAHSHLLDLGQLLPASSDVIVTDFIEGLLLVFSLDWFSLAVDDGVGGDDAVGAGVRLNYLELHLSHSSPHQ